MKLSCLLIALIFFQHCSFDNKTGIWNSDEIELKKKETLFKEFKNFSVNENNFNKIVKLNKKFAFDIPKKKINFEWNDIYFNNNNNLINFSYNEPLNFLYRSRKISKNKIDKHILYEKDNLIVSDARGNIIIFSIAKNQIITKFNFYKKKYKRLEKKLNLVLYEGIIYASDNLGYVYAYDYKQKKIVWAKKYQIPFRSNLKIFNKKLITADQNNNIHLLNLKNGNSLKSLPTEETKIKNKFINNFSLNKDSILMLNTYGSLYAINNYNNNLRWFINLNQSTNINQSNQFYGNPIVSNDNFIIVTTNDSTYIINASNGAILKKLKIISQVKPLIVNKYLFLISSNNLLICINLVDGEIIYSYDINESIAKYYDIKKKEASFKNIIFANDMILILLQNSNILKIDIKGNLNDIFKLPKQIYSDPLFIDNSILYLDNKNKLIILG